MNKTIGYLCVIMAISILLLPSLSYANNCYHLSAGNVSSIDLNGKDMWLHLTDIQKFLSDDVSCIFIENKQFNVSVIEDGNLLLLKLPRPEINTFKIFVAGLMQ